MADVSGLEKQLDDVFGKQAPKMPEGGKKFFVEWLPILTLIGAVLSVLSAWTLWQSANRVNELVGWVNDVSKAYGGSKVSTGDVTLWVWLAVIFTAVQAVIYFMAYNPLKARQKKGWDLLFYARLLSVAYSILMLFIDGRGFGSLLFGLLATALGWWILFQIRPAYLGKHPAESASKE